MKQFKGNTIKQWGKLTNDDLGVAAGRADLREICITLRNVMTVARWASLIRPRTSFIC